MEFNLICLSFC